MSYIVKYLNIKIDIDGNRCPLTGRDEIRKFSTQKELFDFIEHTNENQTIWKYLLSPGEKIESSNIVILKPKIEKTKSKNGRINHKLIGFDEYPVEKYKKTFCRICGRTLSDPLSVRRGIGPECYLKYK
jgi:hypothetical protein